MPHASPSSQGLTQHCWMFTKYVSERRNRRTGGLKRDPATAPQSLQKPPSAPRSQTLPTPLGGGLQDQIPRVRPDPGRGPNVSYTWS